MLDPDFKIERPMRYYRQGLHLLQGEQHERQSEEVKDKGIDVECLNTYFVVRVPGHFFYKAVFVVPTRVYFQVSNLSKIRKPSAMIPTPKAYVRSVLSKVACKLRLTGLYSAHLSL